MAKLAVTLTLPVTLRVDAAGGQDPVAPADEVVAGGRDGRHRCRATWHESTVCGVVAADGAVRARRVGEGEGVDGEAGGDVEIGRDVGVGAAGGQDPVAPADEVVAGVRGGRHRAAAGAVVHTLRAEPRDRAACARRVGEREGVDGEGRADVEIGRDVGVDAAGGQDPVAPADEVVAGGRDGRHLRCRWYRSRPSAAWSPRSCRSRPPCR